ncbi:MAG: aldo/keto reductase [Chlamydiae bacterium]|nr:aldo/keto reductase [Chlamydiota bacterium]MBI3276780.1 aldo/keto reductase [Chlamydiota bacterium]
MKSESFATPQGTENFRKRFEGKTSPEHFRNDSLLSNSLYLSSLGLGTYLGDPDDETDNQVEKMARLAVQSGVNVIDTAINYRYQRAERSIGRSLHQMFTQDKINRNEIVISTKGGFIPFNGKEPETPDLYIQKNLIDTELAFEEEIVAGCHCISPSYLQSQINQSLVNLHLSTIDIYYVHNPETQLREVSRNQFYKRIQAAFKLLEENVAQGKIRCYGTATWTGFLANPKTKDYLSLKDLIQIAHDVGGTQHHFKAIQLPYNLAMPEALLHRNQELNGQWVSLLTAAQNQGFIVMSSASLLQGRLAETLPEAVHHLFKGLKTPAQKSIQFVRSTPGITTALVGMKSQAHLKENTETLQHELEPESITSVFEN